MPLISSFTRTAKCALTILATVKAACLSESTNAAGVEDGTIVSNLAEIAAIGAIGASVNSFTTCKDGNGKMVGVQFSLNTDAGVVDLTAMGDMTQTCQKLTLSGPIEKIRASYAQSDSSVSAVKYYKGGNSKTYGTLISSYLEWNFSETVILMGVYGRQSASGDKITQLGFIQYDTAAPDCPVTVTTENEDGTTTTTTVVETGTAEEILTETTETVGSPSVEEGLMNGDENWTVIAILAGLGLIVFLQIVCIICACTYKKKRSDMTKVQAMNDSGNRLYDSANDSKKPFDADFNSRGRRETDGFETNAGEGKLRQSQGRRKSSTKKQLADIETIEMNDGGEIEMRKLPDPEAHDTFQNSIQNRNESNSSRSVQSDAQLELDQLVTQMKQQANLRPSMPLPAKHASKEMLFP